MSFAGTTPTKFGRFAVSQAFRADRIHFHRGGPLKTVDHESPIPVLDQEDLFKQSIDTSKLIPGAARVDALGSCTCNAGTASLGERYASVHGAAGLAKIGLSTTNAVADEEFAIRLYHAVTDQTGDPAQEWPPTDAGSTGLYVCQELQAQGHISGHKTVTDMTGLVSLLQGGTVIQGTPFFNAWMTPDARGFVDGSGGMEDLEAAIKSGVAGGHETCITAVEQLDVGATGKVNASKTVVRVRNSWSTAFGDHGSFRLHLSTLEMLGSYCDFQQFVV